MMQKAARNQQAATAAASQAFTTAMQGARGKIQSMVSALMTLKMSLYAIQMASMTGGPAMWGLALLSGGGMMLSMRDAVASIASP